MLNAGSPAMHGASGFFNYASRWVAAGLGLVAGMADLAHQLG